MIRVYDNNPNIDATVVLTTINCDGQYRYWRADSLEEFHKWWWDEDYDGPAAEDEVVEFTVDGACGRGNIQTFDDIVLEYGFSEEIKPTKVKIKAINGTPEWAHSGYNKNAVKAGENK